MTYAFSSEKGFIQVEAQQLKVGDMILWTVIRPIGVSTSYPIILDVKLSGRFVTFDAFDGGPPARYFSYQALRKAKFWKNPPKKDR